ILAHDRFVQVQRLVARLFDPGRNLFLVHLDEKVATPQLMQSFTSWAKQALGEESRRVRIFSEFSVHRGGRSMLDVQLRAFHLLIEDPRPWDFFMNLGDTHYPAESFFWMGSYLWLHRGTNYARITSTKYYDPTLQGGSGATYNGPRKEDVYIACDRSLSFECGGQLFSLAPGVKFPPVLSGVTVTAASGPEWVILSRSFVEYTNLGLQEAAAGEPRRNPVVRRIYEDLAGLSIPEETFFQTLLLSSPFCQTVLRHEFLYLDLYDAPWRTSPDSDFPFQSPRPLNATHLAEIGRDEPWFVRKIDSSLPAALSLRGALDASVSRRSSCLVLLKVLLVLLLLLLLL
ncbi:unnamed protein product, partial [Polarella glacialis]